MKKQMKRRLLALTLAAGMLLAAAPVTAEEMAAPAIADAQTLDSSYTLALAAINSEDYETAKDYLDICFVYCSPQNNPQLYADLLLKRACINVIEEKNTMALLNLEAALRLQPELAEAFLVRTQIYTASGEFDKAVTDLEKYIELTRNETMYETVAQLYEAAGNLPAAQEAYDKYATGAGKENPEAGFQAGLYRMDGGKWEEAVEAFQAYKDDETYGAGAQYNIGVSKMNLQDLAGAIEAFNACEEKGGTFSGLYLNRGVCYLLSSSWEKAAEDFNRSIELDQFKEDAWYDLGICYLQMEKYAESVAAFDTLIKAVEGKEDITLNDGVYYYRAMSNAALGNLEEAVKDLTTCIDHGYELAQTYYQRAQVYAAMGDTEKQKSDLENSLKNTK